MTPDERARMLEFAWQTEYDSLLSRVFSGVDPCEERKRLSWLAVERVAREIYKSPKLRMREAAELVRADYEPGGKLHDLWGKGEKP